ncbi:hypothetical protein F4777DRAFT_583049 [Nemania sp. FL0916]|nr:hypothetical protein F4777DRAFT_583049 [Nemania sp. FL0916]
MGQTYGRIVYRWQERYYAHRGFEEGWNDGFSLGTDIPSDPEEYQRWLQQKRSQHSALAMELDKSAYTISRDTVDEDRGTYKAEPQGLTLSIIASERLLMMPSYVPPIFVFTHFSRLNPSMFCVIDLDEEILAIHDSCFFHLSNLPQNVEKVIPEAQEYWMGRAGGIEVDESITTNEIPPIPLTSDPTPAFLQLHPITVDPKKESRPSREPAFVNTEDIKISPWDDYAAVFYRDAVEENKEFITKFIHGYHLKNRETGSAPQLTSYWFSGALVCLRRDITSREKFYDAIVSAVETGKAEGQTHFSAIIISLKHFILLRFSDGKVQHTRRLNFHTCPELAKQETIGIEWGPLSPFGQNNQSSSSNEGNQDLSDDRDWAENGGDEDFAILASFFDAMQQQQLKPIVIVNEGVFPNEIYHHIISYVDRKTNIACLDVSRLFRGFALETFHIDRGMKLLYCTKENELQCVSSQSGLPEACSEWVPAFGMSDGSASIEPDITLTVSLLQEAIEEEG